MRSAARAAERLASVRTSPAGPRSIAAVAAFAVSIAVYGATLLRGVSSFDAAEMQTVPPTLGIAHPTGYPLWTILGYAWTRIPAGSPALMMNLLSAILFAAAAATLTLVCIRLDVRPVLAAVGGVTFAFAGETWARATQAEVHALHTFLFAVLLLAWIVAEQTGSRRAALAMILVTALGLAHHRLMAITGLPLLAFFFARHLGLFRSRQFLLDAALCALPPLAVYLYIPVRADQGARVVNADTTHGAIPIIRGDVFGRNEDAFSRGSIGRFLHALPGYGDLAHAWLGWVAVGFAVLGAAHLLFGRIHRRRPVFVGLALVTFTSTYGLANRLDRDYRWLIVPTMVVCICVSLGLEFATRAAQEPFRGGRLKRLTGLVPLLAFVIPVVAVVAHFSTYDRSGDVRDASNASRILAAVQPHAIIWSYWDVRTTLEYATAVRHVRRDVTVLDHRAYARYGCAACEGSGDAVVALGAAGDPSFAGRPLYYIPLNGTQLAAVTQRYRVEPVIPVDLPFGFDYRGTGALYLIRR